MKAVTRCAAFAISVPFVLAGCASAPDTPDMPAPGAVSTSATDTAATITGSRIPAKRTDKMVSQIGGQDYKDNKSALAAPLQSN